MKNLATLRRNEFNVFEQLHFDAVVHKFPQVFVFVCGVLHEEASILFAQIVKELKSEWAGTGSNAVT